MSKKKKGSFQAPKGPLEWIYVLEEGKTMRDLYQALQEKTDYVIEYWEEAGVLEVALEEAGSIDMEQSEEEDVLWVTLPGKGYEKASEAIKEIEKSCGGHFEVDA